MRDETLDSLLAAAIDSRDTTILLIIADRLEETGHPAAVWWRSYIVSDTVLTRFGYLTLNGMSIYLRNAEPGFPGAKDLVERIDMIRLWKVLRYLRGETRENENEDHCDRSGRVRSTWYPLDGY